MLKSNEFKVKNALCLFLPLTHCIEFTMTQLVKWMLCGLSIIQKCRFEFISIGSHRTFLDYPITKYEH